MKQSVSLVSVGVGDYERAKAFYPALGWSPAFEMEEINPGFGLDGAGNPILPTGV